METQKAKIDGRSNETSSPLLFNIYIEELIRIAPENTSYEVHVSGNEIGYYVFDVIIGSH